MGSKVDRKVVVNKFSDRIVLRKGKSLYEALLEKYAIRGETFSDRMINLAEYLLSGTYSEVTEECGCEGCSWYDGWDATRNKPKCLNLSPPIDKRFLSRTSGKICQQMQEEQIRLQTALGKNVTRKNVGVVLTMANKLNVMSAEMEAVNRERQFLKNEVTRINRDLSPTTTISERSSSSMLEIRTLKENLVSKDSKIQTLSEQVKGLEKELAEYMKYDLKVDCEALGQQIWFFKECIPRMKESDCWKNCSSYLKLLVDAVSVTSFHT